MYSTRVAALLAATVMLTSDALADNQRAPSSHLLPQIHAKPGARSTPASATIQTRPLTMTGMRSAAVPSSIVLQTRPLTMTGMRGVAVSSSITLQTRPLTMTGMRGAVASGSITIETATLTMTGVRP